MATSGRIVKNFFIFFFIFGFYPTPSAIFVPRMTAVCGATHIEQKARRELFPTRSNKKALPALQVNGRSHRSLGRLHHTLVHRGVCVDRAGYRVGRGAQPLGQRRLGEHLGNVGTH